MNSLKKNFLYNAFYQILTILIPLVTTPYISRVLRPEGIGAYSYAYSVAYYFVMFTVLGLNHYGNRTIAIVRNNKKELSKNFSNMYITQLILGLILTVVYMIYSLFIAKEKIVAFILGFYVISGVFEVNWFFYGLEEFKITVVRNTVVKIISTLAIFVFVRSSSDLYKYCLIIALNFLVSQLCVWPFLIKRIEFILPCWAEAKQHIKPNLILFMVPLAVSLFKIMDKIMLGIMTNNTQVGFYESSEKIINIPIALVTALGTVMLPRMSNIVASGKEKGNEIIQASLLFGMLLTSSMCFGIMSVSDIIVPMFYGYGYDECIELFMILLPSCIFLAFANVIRTQYLVPHKMDKTYVISAFIGAGVNIIANLLLIPSLEAKGAAIGTLLAEVSVCIYQCIKVRKVIEVSKYAFQTLPAIIAGVAMFLIVRAIDVDTSELVQLIVKVVFGAISYVSIFILFCVLNRKTYFKIIRTLRKM